MKASKLLSKRKRLGVTQDALAKHISKVTGVAVSYQALKAVDYDIFGVDEETYVWLDRLIDEVAELQGQGAAAA